MAEGMTEERCSSHGGHKAERGRGREEKAGQDIGPKGELLCPTPLD